MDRSVAKFVRQLYNMVSDPTTDSLIRFRKGGDSFEVLAVRELEDTIFPAVFRHRNYSSFHRQLLTHEFVKVGAPNEFVYKHPSFVRDRPELLVNIRRVPVKHAPASVASAASGAPRVRVASTSVASDAARCLGNDEDTKPGADELLECRLATLEHEFASLRLSHQSSLDELKAQNAQLWNIIVAQEEAQSCVQTALRALFGYLSSNGIVDLNKIFDPSAMASSAATAKKRKRESTTDMLSRLSILPAATPRSASAASSCTGAPFPIKPPARMPTLASLSDYGLTPVTPLSALANTPVWPRMAPQVDWRVPLETETALDPDTLRAEVRARKREAQLFDLDLEPDAPAMMTTLVDGDNDEHARSLDSLASTVLGALAEGAAERAAMIRSYQDSRAMSDELDGSPLRAYGPEHSFVEHYARSGSPMVC